MNSMACKSGQYSTMDNIQEKNVSLVYKDAMVLMNLGKYEIGNPVILHKAIIKNMGEKITEIEQKVNELKTGKLEETYEIYIGNGYFFCLHPSCSAGQIVKYNSVVKDVIVSIENLPCFTFTMKDLTDLLNEWSDIEKHMKIEEMKTTCTPKQPCEEKTCYNCKL